MKNVVELVTAAASPPMSDASAARSWGTYHVYWTALPSSKPNWPPGSNCDVWNAGPGGKLPSLPRARMNPVAGLKRYSQLAARPHHGRGQGVVAEGGGETGDGEVVDGVLEGDRAPDGVVDGGQVERAPALT